MVQVFLRDPRRVVVLVLAALAALAAATTLLARYYHGEQIVRAERHLDVGQHLMAEGAIAEAVPEFRASLALARDNPEPARLLAQALLALGRLDEAHTYLRDLLGRFPVDGRVNRDMARVAVARGRHADARAHYQRAIHGEWPDDPLDRRLETRFELVEYLRRIDERQELVAELLLIKAEAPAERASIRRRLATLLVDANLVDQAIDTLRDASAATPDDIALLVQLADTQMGAGRMADARTTFRGALALEPGSRALRDQITLIDRVLALDPTLPRLRLVERTQRARAILAAVVQQITACDVPDAPEDKPFRDRAAPYLRRGIRDAEAAEEALRLAAEIWDAAPVCHDDTPESRAIDRVLQVVALPQDPAP